MSESTLLDIDRLIAPVSDAAPAGSDPRYLPISDKIRAARRDAEANAGDTSEQMKWAAVVDLATEALQTEAKDLQLAVWLLEALARVEGFQGAAAGFTLLQRLIGAYWDTLFPPVDPEDSEPLGYRIGVMSWVEDRLPLILKNVPLSGAPQAYTLLHYDATQRTGKERQALTEDGWPTTEQFEAAMQATDLKQLEATLANIKAAEEALLALERAADERFVERRRTEMGVDRIDMLLSFTALKETIHTALWIVDRVAARKRPKPLTPADAATPGIMAAGGVVSVPVDGDTGTSAARDAVRGGQLGGLQLLQQRVSTAQSGRDRFLRLLEFAEIAFDAGLESLAHPIFLDLAQTIDSRSLEGWEHNDVLLRVFRGLSSSSRRLSAIAPDLTAKAAEADDRVQRLEAASAGTEGAA